MNESAKRQELDRMYGRSYFGSGGCYGRVFCSANCREYGTQDNGFVSGPDGIEVIDPTKPARAYGRGGDCIGRGGREWSEAWEWVPGEGWKRASLPGTEDERIAWREAADAPRPDSETDHSVVARLAVLRRDASEDTSVEATVVPDSAT